MPNENFLIQRNLSRVSMWSLVAVGIAVFGIPILLGGWFSALPKAYSQFRNPLIGLAGLTLVAYPYRFYPWRGLDADRLVVPLLLLYLFAFVKAAFLDFAAFSLNAIDFSMYDHAMANTLAGHFMETVTGVNHFGIHATPVLFLLLPFHALFHSPSFALYLHPLALWAGAVALDRLAKGEGIRGWPRIGLLFSYLNSVLISKTLHYGFHVEVFYPLFGFLLLGTFRRGKTLVMFGALILFLSIKEDAPFYAIGILSAAAMTRRIRWPVASAFIALSVGVVIFYLRVLIPMNSEGAGYAFVGAAAGFGDTPGTAVLGAISHPVLVLQHFFSGGWWAFILPSLGLLVFSPFFWVSALPFFGIYALSGSPLMSGLALYYGMPFVPIFFFGWLDGMKRDSPPKRRVFSIAIATLGVCLFGSGYLVFRKTNFERFRSFTPIAEVVAHESSSVRAPGEKICAPGILIPHLGYPAGIHLLDPSCLLTADRIVIAEPTSAYRDLAKNSPLSSYPLDPAQAEEIWSAVSSWPVILNSGEFSLRQNPDSDKRRTSHP
jgi:uncharacterized membrane protein